MTALTTSIICHLRAAVLIIETDDEHAVLRTQLFGESYCRFLDLPQGNCVDGGGVQKQCNRKRFVGGFPVGHCLFDAVLENAEVLALQVRDEAALPIQHTDWNCDQAMLTRTTSPSATSSRPGSTTASVDAADGDADGGVRSTVVDARSLRRIFSAIVHRRVTLRRETAVGANLESPKRTLR